MKLFLDFETRSRADLVGRGLPRYATHPSTEILCVAWATDEDPDNIELWHRGQGPPEELFALVERADHICAHNAAFEMWVWREIAVKQLGWPLVPANKWECTAAKCAYNNLPRSLESSGERLKIKGAAKDKEGKKVMMLLTKPNKRGEFIEEPSLFAKLYDYCKQDVRAEMAVDRALVEMPAREERLWKVDRTINERGVPIDTELCEMAYNLSQDIVEQSNLELERLTAGEVTTTTQVAKLLNWVQKQGANIASLAKVNVDEALKSSEIPPLAKRALELRQIGAPASVKKFKAAMDYTSDDARARDQFLYYGAGTGRWSGRSIQLQNLFRKASEAIIEAIQLGDIELLGALAHDPMSGFQMGVRGMVCAPDGSKLVFSDLSAIEARVLLWAAGSRRGVQLFRDSDSDPSKPDPYRVMAGKIYSVDATQIPKKGERRQVGKVAILGLGYGMGASKFQLAAWTMGGVRLDMAMCEKVVSIYRRTHPEVVLFWRHLQEAFGAAAAGAKKVDLGRGIVFSNVRGAVAMMLPSGRQLFYHEPKALKRGNIEFTDSRGVRIHTWGGLLAENAVQAISRDVIADQLVECERRELNPVLHVHDEIALEQPEHRAQWAANQLTEIMQTPPSWAPGLPLAAETRVRQRLTK